MNSRRKEHLIYSLHRSREILRETSALEDKIEHYKNRLFGDYSFNLPGQDLVFNTPNIDFKGDIKIFDLMFEEEVFVYADYLIRHLDFFSRYIPKRFLSKFFDLFGQYEELISKALPEYDPKL